MSGPTVRVITNSLGSGDYTVVLCEGDVVWEGHSIGAQTLYDIMQATYGFEYIHFAEVTDQQMEEGNYYD